MAGESGDMQGFGDVIRWVRWPLPIEGARSWEVLWKIYPQIFQRYPFIRLMSHSYHRQLALYPNLWGWNTIVQLIHKQPLQTIHIIRINNPYQSIMHPHQQAMIMWKNQTHINPYIYSFIIIIPSGNQTWQWKIPYTWKFLARKVTDKWSIFQQDMFD